MNKQSEHGFSSEQYWIDRYKSGGNSGKGSYGLIAAYKGEVVNSIIQEFDIGSVVEFGSGDGNQLSYYEISDYTGLDVSGEMIDSCRARYADKKKWRFIKRSEVPEYTGRHDMAMSIDVIFHLIEDDVYEKYMTELFDCATRFVLIYSTDKDGTNKVAHFRSRKYSRACGQSS